jgi:uncharacterized alkaline shock family protein YloU
MTPDEQEPSDLDPSDLDPSDLDGYSIEELSDYLDSGRTPRDPGIEDSPGARTALDALARLRQESWAMIEVEALAQPSGDQAWITTVLSNISRESRAGRDIPIHHDDARVRLSVTEGSVRGLVRGAGDGIAGALVGKVDLRGDVTVPSEPITVDVSVSGAYGQNVTAAAAALRAQIDAELRRNTELNVVAINITVQDVHDAPAASPKKLP